MTVTESVSFDRARLRDDALAAWDAGLCVLPVATDGEKRPAVNWKDYQSERPTRDAIEAWFSTDEFDGFGIVCGETSGNLECLELEGRAVDDGTYTKFVAALQAAGLGELFDRICTGYLERSPSDGLHLLYRCDEITGNLKLASRPTSDGADVLIETRGEGGFIVVAPSGGRTHPTGKPWERELGSFEEIATITPNERAELHRVAGLFDEMPVRAPSKPKATTNGSGTRPGDDFDEKTSWGDVLEPAGWTRVYDHDLETAWRRPGKDHGISATTNHLGTDTLKVFSSSTPIPTDGTHSRFGAYSWLHHGGDVSAAARELARQGYGDQTDVDGYMAKVRGVNAEPDARGAIRDPALALPDEFWTARPELEHIRRSAHSRSVSAEAVLGVVLGRVAAASPHTIEIPDHVGAPCGLSMIVMIVGPPGISKTAAVRNGTDLVPPGLIDPRVDSIGPGSGEGLIEVLFEFVDEPRPENPDKTDRVRRQVRYNAFLYGDEAEAVIRQASRSSSGSTFLVNLRSIFTSGAVGQANVGDNFRQLDAGSYVYTVVLGVQPTKARALFDDHGAGTPQRFLWCPATTPIPGYRERPERPGPLEWEPPGPLLLEEYQVIRAGRFRHQINIDPAVVSEIVENYDYRQNYGCDFLDVHRDLIRAKVGGVFGLLNGRLDDSTEDWELAGMVMDMSDATRATVLAALDAEGRDLEHARRERDAGRKIHVDDATEAHHWHRVVECAKRIAGKVHDGGDWTVALLRRALRRWIDVLDDALAHAETEGWITTDDEPGQGRDKRVVRPGPKKPS